MSRTSTYLNFPGFTERAFLFYKSVFGGDFIDGIHRFGDIPLWHSLDGQLQKRI